MFSYLLQMIACSGLLYGYYHFFLRNERFHQYNRFYLLASLLFSLLVPLLKIPVWFKANNKVLSNLENIYISEGESVTVGAVHHRAVISMQQALWAVVLVIILILLIRLFIAIRQVYRIKRNGTIEKIKDIDFIETIHPDAPFSFFRWLFWNKRIDIRSADGQQIFRHEVYHIEQRHSIDILFIELLICLCWFNPFLYLYRKEIKAIQEFLADKYAASGYDQYNYATLLVMQTMSARQTSLVNPFFHNQLKRRIAMLTTSKKPAYRYLRKIMVLPIAACIFALFAFTYKRELKKMLPEPVSAVSTPVQASSPEIESRGDVRKDTVPYRSKTAIAGKTNNREVTAEYMTEKQKYWDLNPVVITSFEGNAPEKKKLKDGETKIDMTAAYPGNWSNFLERNISPVATANGAPAGNYEVMIAFTINEDGSLSGFIPITNEGYGMEDEVIRVLKKSENWKPSVNNKDGGAPKPVKSYRSQRVNFVVQAKNATASKNNNNNAGEAIVSANTSNTAYQREPEIFTKAEHEAEYDGSWREYLQKNLDASVPVKNGIPTEGNYQVIVQFIVNSDGTLRDIKPLTKQGFGMEDEAIRVIKTSGKWKPAMQNGRPVNAYRKQPITFAVQKG